MPMAMPPGYPGAMPTYPGAVAASGFPGAAPMGFPGAAPMGFPGAAPMGFPGAVAGFPGAVAGFPGAVAGFPGAAAPVAAPSGLSAQVVVGAPVMKGPSAPTPAPASAAAPAAPPATSSVIMSAQTAAATFTSNILHQHIFGNAFAGLPLTLYLGNLPLDFEDARLTRMLEVFGKVNRFLRPSDPLTLLPSSIAFVTYAQSICGLRCVKILDGVNIDLEGGEQCIQIKLGTKEAGQIASVQNAETEAALLLPPGSSLSEIYDPMRESMMRILRPPASIPANGSASSAKSVAGESAAAPSEAGEAGEVSEEPVVEINAGAINYYAFLDEEKREIVEGTAAEKMLQSEIDKYRARQNLRDVEVEQIRRQRIKQRVKEIQEAKRLEALRAEKAAAEAANASANSAAADAFTGGSNKRQADDEAELEAKRRRKQEVLRMLAGESGAPLPVEPEPEPETERAPAAASSSAPVPLGTIKLGSLTAPARPKATPAPGVKPVSTFGGADLEDDMRPMRELIRLDYTPQEMSAVNGNYSQGNGAGAAGAASTGGEDDEAMDGVYKKKAPTPAVINEAHAKALAHAQAISAAIAAKKPIVDPAEAARAALKQLIDNIPTEKEPLFAYNINWRVIETHNIVQGTLRAWIVKKIVEYLGEEEESLTTFITSKLTASCRPAELVEELSMVLDEDAEQFVLKLWRMLVYYSLKPQ